MSKRKNRRNESRENFRQSQRIMNLNKLEGFDNAKNIMVRNLIHTSEDKFNADREISLWFSDKEMHSYKSVHDIICFER